MSRNKFIAIIGIPVTVLLLLFCIISIVLYNLIGQQETPQVQTRAYDYIATQAVQTIIFDITKNAVETVEVELTKQYGSVTSTETISSVPYATETQTPAITPAILTPTSTTTTPIMIVPTFTPVPLVCDRAQLVRDVTVEDNTPFAPGTTFVKIWRLRNVGNCTWTPDYRLVFSSGDPLDAVLSVPIMETVQPNQMVDIAIRMRAPNRLGVYRGDWMMSNRSGARFGVGTLGNQSVWVIIRVMDLGNPKLDYDFAANYCQAEWTSGAGRLLCPGTSSATEGFVILLDTPKLENRIEDELALWTHPNNNSLGWISGLYPGFMIQTNQHFRAWVGCLSESKGCNISFRLDFKNLNTGKVKNLGYWQEVYDGNVTTIDIDLSPHVGKRVSFILTVIVNGGNPARANAFWFVPGILTVPKPTNTQTLTPSLTTQPTITSTYTLTPTETLTPTLTETSTLTLTLTEEFTTTLTVGR